MFMNAWRRFLGGLKKQINTGASQGGIPKRRLPLFLEPLEGRILLSTNTWLNPLGGSWNDPSNWSTAALPTAADDVVINLPSAATIRLSGAAASVHSLQVNNTLILDGASLSVAGDVANASEIDLVSTNGNANAELDVGGLFTNTSTGLLSSEQGAGGGRIVRGNWVNQGTVDVQAGTSLNLLGTDSSGPVFTQANGQFTIENGASVVQGNGVFRYTGGALSGDIVVFGVVLDIQNTVASTAVIEVRGQGNVLDENAAPGLTLLVEGNSDNGDGVLTAVDGAVNNGVIELDTTGWYWWLNSSLAVAAGGTFTNGPTGIIRVLPSSSGGRYIDGNFVNQGRIDAAGASVTIQGASFTQAGGDVTSEGGAAVVQSGGVFHYTGGAISGAFFVVGTTLDVQSTVTAAAIIEVRGQGNVLEENASPSVTIRVEGSNDNGDGVLTAVDGAVNDGMIELVTVGWYWWLNSSLAAAPGGTFTNGPTGIIRVLPSSSGNRYIDGNLVNQGIIDAAGASVTIQGPNFTQAGGDITTEGGAAVVQGGGVFHFTGGAVSGAFFVFGTKLDVQDTVTAASVIVVRGQGNVLEENASPSVTIRVEGSNDNGDGILAAVDGAVNDGVIELVTVGWYYWLNSSLAAAPGGTFTNGPTGIIRVLPSASGGRYIDGNWTNEGTVDVQWGELNLWGYARSGPVFTQAGGTVLAENGASVAAWGGKLNFTGGALVGNIVALGSEIAVEATVAAASMLTVRGENSVLDHNLSPAFTIWVQGNDANNNGVLTTAPGAVNAGTILLESASGYWWSILSIQGTLDNTSTGVIQVSAGAGGNRSINGNLTNEGTLAVDANASVEINGNGNGGPTLTQNGGVLQASGRLLLNGGLFDFEGGAVTGNFYAENAQLYVAPDVTDPSLIHAVGGGDVLLDNASASTTILVQGDDGFNAGVLTVAANATNAGVIQLDSTSGYWGSGLSIQDILDNTPTGRIVVKHGAGGARWINGDIDNEGLVSVAADANLDINGANGFGPTFIQDGGSIQADGRIVLHGGLFDFESGDISGAFYVNNAQIYVSPDATSKATVTVVGSDNTLLGNEGRSVTLRVQGDDGFNAGVLTAAAGAVNAGSIVLASTSAYWGSVLAAPHTLLNAQGGLIAVADDDGGGGVRWLSGDFINAGTVFVPTDRQLTLHGAAGAGPTLIQAGGLIAAPGGFVQQGGLFDFESGGVLGAFGVSGAAINVGPDVFAPNTVEVLGGGNTLLDNASVATTLWLQGNDGYGAAVLTAAPGAFNAGTILLASASATFGEDLAAPGGMTNLATGHIAVYGGGGTTALSGTLTNDGYLSLSAVDQLFIDTLINYGTLAVDAVGVELMPGLQALADVGAAQEAAAAGGPAAPLDPAGAPLDRTVITAGSWTNYGAVALDRRTELDVRPDGSGRDTYTQASGVTAADGKMVIDGGLFHYTGGAIYGDFVVRNGQLRVDASAPPGAAVHVVGNSTLLDNSGGATLLVDGGSPDGGGGDAMLTAADGAVNAGLISLRSLDGAHNGRLSVPAGVFTNAAGGTIQGNVAPGQSGVSLISAGGLFLHNAARLVDTTGLALTQSSQSLLALLQYYLANGIPVDPQLLLQATMAQTPGVGDGLIGISWLGAGLGGLPDLTGLWSSGGLLDNLGGIGLQTAGALFGPNGALPPPNPAPAGTGNTGQDTANLIASLNQVRADLESPFKGAAQLVTGYGNALKEAGNILSDAANGWVSLGSLAGNYLFGTPVYNPPPQSAFLRGAEAAGGVGPLAWYLGVQATSAVYNTALLPAQAYNAAGAALSAAATTGNVGPLVVWAGTYGVALGGLAEGAAGLMEGAAGVLRAADAGELAGLGAPDALLNFLADESGAVELPGFADGAGAELPADAAAAPLVEAEGEVAGAVGGAETTVEQSVLAGDAAGASALAQAEVGEAQAEAAGLEAGNATTEVQAGVQQLQQEAETLSQDESAAINARAERKELDSSSQPSGLDILGNDHLPILEGTEQKTINLDDPNWRDAQFISSDDSLVYVLRDADTGELLKVGKSEVSTFIGRFGAYESAQVFTGRNLALDVFAFNSQEVSVTTVESEVRSTLINQGELLPWDNTRLPGAGGTPRLGRPGPGVPGTRPSRKLIDQGWHWEGENFVQ